MSGCPICGDSFVERHELEFETDSIEFDSIYHGAQKVCVDLEIHVLYAHGEPL